MTDSPHPAPRRLRALPAFFRIPFRAVPVKARHDGWTPERQRGFIDRLVVTGNVALSARAVGKTPQSAYRLRDHAGAASFRRAWDKALDAGRSHVIDIAIARGLEGDRVPVMRLGRYVGEVLRYDNRLAMAVLNAMDRGEARRPMPDPALVLERYIESLEPKGEGGSAGGERH